jgi:hypothetical protein
MNTQITRSRVKHAIALTTLLAAFIGGTAVADLGENGNSSRPTTRGMPESGKTAGQVGIAAQTDAITTGGTNFDPTILTKFISGRGFVPSQGSGADADLVGFLGQSCVTADINSGGSLVSMHAPVELPDGAEIVGMTAFGVDNSANDITVTLSRDETVVPLLFGSPSRAETIVSSFSTSGTPGTFALANPTPFTEVVGNGTSGPLQVFHRFHTINVVLDRASGATHALCGVEVRFQVPVSANPGVVFFPLTPFRAFDSRDTDYAQSGLLAPNAVKTISIADGHDLSTGLVNATNLVPSGATAITYNVTVTGATGGNFVSITPGDASTYNVSTINFNGVMDVANGATVGIAGDRTVKLFGGNGGGSTHVIVDVTGYYAPYVPPNMAG